MAESRVAKRYAKSLLDLSAELKEQESAFNDMQLLVDTIEANRDLAIMLNSPVINSEKKLAVIDKIFSDKLSKLSYKFIELITNKGRETQLRDIAKNFIAQYKAGKFITTATVTSSAKLLPDAFKKIEDIVVKHAGGTVELVETVDPELIGGFILRIGDQQLDTSIKSKLNDLRAEFDDNLYEKDY